MTLFQNEGGQLGWSSEHLPKTTEHDWQRNSADPRGVGVISRLSCGSKWINRDHWGWKLTGSPREDPGELFALETLLTSLSCSPRGLACIFLSLSAIRRYQDKVCKIRGAGLISSRQLFSELHAEGNVGVSSHPHRSTLEPGSGHSFTPGHCWGGLILKSANTGIPCQSEQGGPGSLHTSPYNVKYWRFLVQIMPQDKPHTENCLHLQGV